MKHNVEEVWNTCTEISDIGRIGKRISDVDGSCSEGLCENQGERSPSYHLPSTMLHKIQKCRNGNYAPPVYSRLG